MNSEGTYENQLTEILRHLFRMNRFFKDMNLGQRKKTREIIIYMAWSWAKSGKLKIKWLMIAENPYNEVFFKNFLWKHIQNQI